MPKKRGQRRIVLSTPARRDLREIMVWSHTKFGRDAALRYEDLVIQALRDIEADAECPGSQDKSELQRGVRSYHLSFSRDRARTALGIVQHPRHFIIYRCRDGQKFIDVLRILHDARELQRHLPEE